MKKCPFCKAEIEDNARFCLYCMTSLDEKQQINSVKSKNKRWLVILAAFLLFILVIGAICLTLPKNEINNNVDTNASETETVSEKRTSEEVASDVIKDNIIEKSENSSGHLSESSDIIEQTSENNNETNTQQNAVKTEKNNSSTKSAVSNNGENSDGNNQTSTIAKSSKPAAVPSTVATTPPQENTTEAVKSNVTYEYRQAKYGDDFSVSYVFPDNAIVITGVEKPSDNGLYVIPEKIDGQPVVAIMGLAFCDDSINDTVKKVVVPASVKTIWNYAFANCYNLTDIYFCGNAIYTEAQAFAEASKRTGTLTIHCSATCSNRNFRYYKNSADGYDAQYKEWNGGEYN